MNPGSSSNAAAGDGAAVGAFAPTGSSCGTHPWPSSFQTARISATVPSLSIVGTKFLVTLSPVIGCGSSCHILGGISTSTRYIVPRLSVGAGIAVPGLSAQYAIAFSSISPGIRFPCASKEKPCHCLPNFSPCAILLYSKSPIARHE